MTLPLATIGDIAADLRSGFASGDEDPDGVVQFRMNNVGRTGEINWDKLRRVPSTKMKNELAVLTGDILFNATNSPELVGKTALFSGFPEPVTFSNHFIRIRTNRDAAEPAYVARWLQREFEYGRFAGMCRSWVNQASITKQQLTSLSLPLPPLDEQRRIAAILDKADTLRRKRKHALGLLDGLTQSIFLEMFGDPVSNPREWDVRKLGEVADFYSGNSLPAGQEFTGQSNGYLLLKVSDLNKKGNEEVIGASSEWSPSPGTKAGTCKTNAVVFPKRGGAIATNKKRKLFRPAILDPNLMAVAPTDGHVTLDYLFAWFQNFRLQDIASGSSVPQLNKQDLAPLKICTPPRDLQERFAEVSQQIISQRTVAATSTANIEILFSSLQSRAFSGQL